MSDEPPLKLKVEALLLAAQVPLAPRKLAELVSEEHHTPDTEAVRAALDDLGADWAQRGGELVRVASGYRLQVRAEFEPWVARLSEERPPKYSRALLETLALIVYRQPITRAEIEDVRGVSVSSQLIKTLLEREWVQVLGHRDTPGRPAMYGTTRQFLDYFNLRALDQLPTLVEIRDLDAITPEFAFGPAGEEPVPPPNEPDEETNEDSQARAPQSRPAATGPSAGVPSVGSEVISAPDQDEGDPTGGDEDQHNGLGARGS